MAQEFTLDLSKLSRAIRQSPEVAGRGARQAMGDIKDDWIQKSRDLAPINPEDGGNLRREIDGKVSGRGLDSDVIVTAEAAQNGFDYGLYIHEFDAGGKNLRTPGTVKKFFDESAEQNIDDWQQMLEDEIMEEFRRVGF